MLLSSLPTPSPLCCLLVLGCRPVALLALLGVFAGVSHTCAGSGILGLAGDPCLLIVSVACAHSGIPLPARSSPQGTGSGPALGTPTPWKGRSSGRAQWCFYRAAE